jgi:hypothetical protein
MVTALAVNEVPAIAATHNAISLLQNKPNPADMATTISVEVKDKLNYKEAYISISDLNGKEIKRTAITLNNGINEIIYDHGYNVSGTFIYSLLIDGKLIESRRMVFTN